MIIILQTKTSSQLNDSNVKRRKGGQSLEAKSLNLRSDTRWRGSFAAKNFRGH